MGGKKFIKKPHTQQSLIKDALERKLSKMDLNEDKSFLISFKHLDKSQGQSFSRWQESQMLANAMDVLSGYCASSLESQKDGNKFTIYGNFPSRSAFVHPKHVPEDADWARIHINGTHIVAGHVFRNIFYVVFLDEDHSFFITEKR